MSASQGMMLESVSERLCGPGGPHEHAPDKRPRTRLAMIRRAGELRIPFTSGILIGIGETARSGWRPSWRCATSTRRTATSRR